MARKNRLTIKSASYKAFHLNPNNAREHDERQKTVLRDSLLTFQQQTPIVVDSNMTVRKGNGTFETICEIHADENIPASVKKKLEKVYYIETDLAGPELVGWEIVDNRSSDLSRFNTESLKGLFKGLKETSFNTDHTGFDNTAVGAMFQTEDDASFFAGLANEANAETNQESGPATPPTGSHQSLIITGPAPQIDFCRKVINKVKKDKKLATQAAALHVILEAFSKKK